MKEIDFLAGRFEEHRTRLRAVAYRMLGSFAEADDAVQEAWLRLARTDDQGIDNLGGWLTTVVGRVCLDMLRTRKSRREDALDVRLPDPVLGPEDRSDPEEQALLADSVGLALLVVLESLPPAERLAFVLHDMFAVSFDEIAPIVGRSPAAARQLASRARRRVQKQPRPESDPSRQRRVVDAFLAASRDGDFDALVAVLDPDAVLRADYGELVPAGVAPLLRGGRNIAAQALMFSTYAAVARPAVVNGSAALVTAREGDVYSIMAFTVRDDMIAEIDVYADRTRLAGFDLSFLD